MFEPTAITRRVIGGLDPIKVGAEENGSKDEGRYSVMAASQSSLNRGSSSPVEARAGRWVLRRAR